MAELVIHIKRIKENITYLSDYFDAKNIEWSLVTKVFSGDQIFLKKLLTPDTIQKINSVGDSRLTSLRNLREVNPNMKTIYIKPPAQIYSEDIVKYADISLNTSLSTIKALNKAAKAQGKRHEIIIMIEMGELREGVNREEVIDFYKKVFNLSNIDVVGIGSNLGCMYGVEPTYDKLLQLYLYKELISARFNKELKLISGGTSITLPLIEKGFVPEGINHYRVGEAVFFGVSPLDNKPFKDLHTETFEFYANIIELEEKKLVPDGVINNANIGHTTEFNKENRSETSYKAILDFGLLDVDKSDIEVEEEGVSFVGITSDMIVINLGNNKTKSGEKRYSVGDKIKFKPSYMAVARLLNSKFIEKLYV